MSEDKVVRERASKVYVITNKDSGEKVFVKAKTRTAVGEHLIAQNFDISMVSPKDMADFAVAVQNGVAIHEI
jgi:hypothetical protein